MNNLFKNRKLKFIVIGLINTIFGYFAGVTLLLYLVNKLPVIIISFLISVLTISFSILMYKYFLFNNSNNTIVKIFSKGFITYSISTIFSSLSLYGLISIMKLNIYLSQTITIAITTIIIWVLHNNFTFK